MDTKQQPHNLAPPPSDPSQQIPPSQPGMPGGPPMTPGMNPYQPQKTNTLAIVTLVMAFIFPLVSLITGFIALSQIKKTGESGRGLAIGGLVVSFFQFLLLILLIVLFTFSGVQGLARDAERKTDLEAIQGHLEAYAAANDDVYPPTLSSVYLPGLDPEATRDPDGSTYEYLPTPIGCIDDCSGYTLTTVLEENGLPYTKQNLL